MQKARNLVKFFLFSALVVLLFSVIVLETDTKFGLILFVIGMALCALGVYFMVMLCRCPHCGHIILMGGLARTHCPRCRKQLVSDSSSGSSSKKSASHKSSSRKRR